MRRRRPVTPDNHDRWLVSYADFITLMFAFFVVMFAASQADKTKVRKVSEAVSRALEEGAGHRPARERLDVDFRNLKADLQAAPPAAILPQAADLLPSLEYLQKALQHQIEGGEMRVALEGRGLVITLQQATFFPSGEDTIDPQTFPSFEKVAMAISQLPNPVRLEGHTDSNPIHTARFRSNWDLSAARAIAVLDLLSARFHIPRERLAVAGYAETAPVADNASAEGRGRNRRVDIVILNRQQTLTEPAPATPPRSVQPPGVA